MTKQLGWSGVAWRFLFAMVVVFGSYNPSGYSFYDWGIRHFLPLDPLKAVIGLLLLIGWVIFLRATLRSLGGFGLVLVCALFAALLWLAVDWGLLPRHSITAVTYAVLLIVSLILTVGMCWSHVRRRLSGQQDTDDVETHD